MAIMKTGFLAAAALITLLLGGCASGTSPLRFYRPMDDAGPAWRIDVARHKGVIGDTFTVHINGKPVASTKVGLMKISSTATGHWHGHLITLECRALASVWSTWVSEDCSVLVGQENAGVFSF